MTVGTSIYVKVVAYNSIGLGQESTIVNGAIVSIYVVPDAPIRLVRDNSTTTSQIGLSWSQGLSNGGLPVIDYRVSFDQGTGVYIVIQSGVTSLSYIKTTLT